MLVIVVDVPPELQVDRLVSQRGVAPGQARARMAAQASREQRLAIADVVIDNSGSVDDVDAASPRSGPTLSAAPPADPMPPGAAQPGSLSCACGPAAANPVTANQGHWSGGSSSA